MRGFHFRFNLAVSNFLTHFPSFNLITKQIIYSNAILFIINYFNFEKKIVFYLLVTCNVEKTTVHNDTFWQSENLALQTK